MQSIILSFCLLGGKCDEQSAFQSRKVLTYFEVSSLQVSLLGSELSMLQLFSLKSAKGILSRISARCASDLRVFCRMAYNMR